MKDGICDFSLMIIIYMFLAFPQFTHSFAHSILGRVLAVVLIAIYSTYDVLYGLLFCILVIIFYFYTEPKLSVGSREGFLYEYQLAAGKTDDYYAVPHDATPYQPYDSTPLVHGDTEKKFVKKNCPNGNLTQTDSRGDFQVPTEMAGHIYPELAYPGPPCNPCSSQCAFKVVDTRLKAEEELVLPKSANEWFDTILQRLNS